MRHEEDGSKNEVKYHKEKEKQNLKNSEKEKCKGIFRY